jgi:hypothetical protein
MSSIGNALTLQPRYGVATQRKLNDSNQALAHMSTSIDNRAVHDHEHLETDGATASAKVSFFVISIPPSAERADLATPAAPAIVSAA